ncbi:hypothetical protein GN244_ATG18774 [Phytophthora infestans]|uniref:Uncharacterized protein n=1 Tax=Phytophthora infestans TaxID=4787 RepID=A0A833SQI0_PHYIN|nr:hypothetical protein GN244_ATG18774 [Phytophthora infestans]
MVGPTCKQCEAKIDPLLAEPAAVYDGPLERAASAAGSWRLRIPYNQRAGHRAALYCLRERPKMRLSFGRKAPTT